MRSDFSNGQNPITRIQDKMHKVEQSLEPMCKDCNGPVKHAHLFNFY